jgi:ankyrin repeat protein
LCREHCDTNCEANDGLTALHFATMYGYVETVRCLVSTGGASVEAQTSSEGLTALHIAGRNCNLEMVKSLLILRASTNTKDNKGRTPLEYVNQTVLSQSVPAALKSQLVLHSRQTQFLAHLQRLLKRHQSTAMP